MAHVLDWTNAVKQHDLRNREPLPEEIKLCALKGILPSDLQDRIDTNASTLSSFKSMLDYVNGQINIWRPASTHVPMDCSLLDDPEENEYPEYPDYPDQDLSYAGYKGYKGGYGHKLTKEMAKDTQAEVAKAKGSKDTR